LIEQDTKLVNGTDLNSKNHKITSTTPLNKSIQLYKAGFSLREISKKMGIPRETLRIKLVNGGLKLRKSKRDMPIVLHEPVNKLDAKCAELLAMHAGDGCLDVTGRWSFSSNKNDQTLVNHVANLIKDVIGVVPNINVNTNRIEIRSGHRQVFNYFSKFFPIGNKTFNVNLPHEIMTSKDLDIKHCALKGLFSTDGSFSFKKNKGLFPRIEFRVKSKKLRDQFVTLAKDFNFKFNFNTQSERKGIIYTAYIEKINEVIRWMNEISSVCDTHIKNYNHWYKLKFGGGA